jgi:hypothetical protein
MNIYIYNYKAQEVLVEIKYQYKDKTNSNTKPGTAPKQMAPSLKTITPGKASKNRNSSKPKSKTQPPHS